MLKMTVIKLEGKLWNLFLALHESKTLLTAACIYTWG